MRMLLIIILCIFMSETTRSQPDSNQCSVMLPDNSQQVDCSNSPCMLRANNTLTLQPIPPPIENHYQCYDTCFISEDINTQSPQCIASPVPIPIHQSMMKVSGPFHLKQYSIYSLSSPQNNASSYHYPNNKHCKYHLMCEESNSFLSLLLQDIDTEGPSDECTDNISCLDFIRFEFPTGSQCTVCGSDLICHETGRRLNPLLLFNGHHPGLIITFQSNRKGRSCGFHFLATCVKKEYFESSDCIVPPQFIPPTNPPPFPIDFGKRAVSDDESSVDDDRMRSYQRHGIAVYSYASVTYDNNVVRVLVDDTYVHSFPGVRVLQVYNSIEGSLTYYGTANDRSFPGYGVLNIGIGIVYYIQESVPSQFKPNKSEQRLIQLLHHGLLEHRHNIINDNQCYTQLTVKQLEEIEQAAIDYGQACNGFLRAAACAYQQLHMTRVRTDCLVNVTFPTSTPPSSVPFLETSSGSGAIIDE